MAQTQTLKRRIRSVENTKQITKAMELVAASKMRKAQEATISAKDYTHTLRQIVTNVYTSQKRISHPLLEERTVQSVLLIAFTSDRGLAGAYNTNVLKQLLKSVKKYDQQNISVHLLTIGQKANIFASRLTNVILIGAYTNFASKPTSHDVGPIISTIIPGFLSTQYDLVEIIGTEFHSTLKQTTNTRQLLPLNLNDYVTSSSSAESKFEPSSSQVFDFILPRLVETEILQAALDASASEQSMRMLAMKNASDNARDIIEDLTLAFNSARQASITQELAEITAGAEAMH